MKKLLIFILLCFLVPTVGCTEKTNIYIGEDGYWYIDDIKTNVYAKGDTGLQGEPGKDGHTPVITIENGYWYVDGVNTEIQATGNDGENGKEGKQGNSIVDIVKSDSNGLEDVYTILFSDGNTTTFTIKNGESGKDAYEIAKEHVSYIIDAIDSYEGELKDSVDEFLNSKIDVSKRDYKVFIVMHDRKCYNKRKGGCAYETYFYWSRS